MSTCKGCGAPVLWVKTKGGSKNMILDAEPSSLGQWAIVEGRAVHKQHAPRSADLYVTHWATCPRAQDYRR